MGICFECGSLKQGSQCPLCDGPATLAAAPAAAPPTGATAAGAPPPVTRAPTSHASPAPPAASGPVGAPPPVRRDNRPAYTPPVSRGTPPSTSPAAHGAPAQGRSSAPALPASRPEPLKVASRPASDHPPPSYSTSPSSFSTAPAPTSADPWASLSRQGAPSGGAGPHGAPPPVSRANKPQYDYKALQADSEMRREHYAKLNADTESSRMAVQQAREALAIGNASLQTLSEQAVQIDNVERDVESMHVQLDRGNRHLRSIEGAFGTVSNLVTGDKNDNNMYFYRAQQRDRTLPQYGADGAPSAAPGQAGGYAAMPPPAAAATAPTAMVGATDTLKAQLAQQDKDLAELEALMGSLSGVAGTMSTELTRQNEQIDRMNVRAAGAIDKTHETNYRINKLI